MASAFPLLASSFVASWRVLSSVSPNATLPRKSVTRSSQMHVSASRILRRHAGLLWANAEIIGATALSSPQQARASITAPRICSSRSRIAPISGRTTSRPPILDSAEMAAMRICLHSLASISVNAGIAETSPMPPSPFAAAMPTDESESRSDIINGPTAASSPILPNASAACLRITGLRCPSASVSGCTLECPMDTRPVRAAERAACFWCARNLMRGCALCSR